MLEENLLVVTSKKGEGKECEGDEILQSWKISNILHTVQMLYTKSVLQVTYPCKHYKHFTDIYCMHIKSLCKCCPHFTLTRETNFRCTVESL